MDKFLQLILLIVVLVGILAILWAIFKWDSKQYYSNPNAHTRPSDIQDFERLLGGPILPYDKLTNKDKTDIDNLGDNLSVYTSRRTYFKRDLVYQAALRKLIKCYICDHELTNRTSNYIAAYGYCRRCNKYIAIQFEELIFAWGESSSLKPGYKPHIKCPNCATQNEYLPLSIKTEYDKLSMTCTSCAMDWYILRRRVREKWFDSLYSRITTS